MEYLTLLNSIIVLWTSTVLLKKSRVEAASAQIKLETEKSKSPVPILASHTSQHSSPVSLRIVALGVLGVATASLLWLAFSAPTGAPASVKDLVLVAFCLINILQGYRWLDRG